MIGYVDFMLLILGTILLVACIVSFKILRKVKKLDEKTALKSTSGIFIEHGMVRSKDGKGVEADQKLSHSYYSID